MFFATILYNAVLVAVDVAVILVIIYGKKKALRRIVLESSFIVMLLAAMVLKEDAFGAIRLVCYGLFVHTPFLMFVYAARSGLEKTRHALIPALAGIVLILVALDAFFVEPTWLDVTHLEIKSSKIANPIRIAIVADIQTDQFEDWEESVLNRVMQEKPDMILLAGDYIQTLTVDELKQITEKFNKFLKAIRLDAPKGVFAVKGNIDMPGWETVFKDTPVKAVSRTTTFDLGDMTLTALSQEESLSSTLAIPETKKFHIVLGHHPDFALGKVKADLLIAGHTHGGQIRLPFIGPVKSLSKVPRSWAAGMTERVGGGKLVVSRGIGHERGHAPRIRFLCRPELIFLELSP